MPIPSEHSEDRGKSCARPGAASTAEGVVSAEQLQDECIGPLYSEELKYSCIAAPSVK